MAKPEQFATKSTEPEIQEKIKTLFIGKIESLRGE
jgi:hypothetical protein